MTPSIRVKALELTQNLQQKDYMGEVHALWEFVRDRIRYVRDIDNVETLQTADRTLSQASGDCDDKSVLLASLLGAIGHKSRFVAVALRDPENFVHVLVETLVGKNQWLAAETTEPQRLGWRPPRVANQLIKYV